MVYSIFNIMVNIGGIIMVWLIGALVGIVCFSIMDHFKVPTLLQWIIVFFILMMFL